MRPFGQAGPAIGMAPAMTPQQPAMGAGGPLNANNTGFGGHLQACMNAAGVYEECTVKSIVCEGKNFGLSTQNFSSDMLRWDDYRQLKSINDGTPALKPTFDTNTEGMMQHGLPFAGHREIISKAGATGQAEKINNLLKVFVCHPRLGATPAQNFCSEMERWDHMRTQKQINDGTPNMRQTFAAEGGAVLVVTDTDTSRRPTSSNAPPSLMGGVATNATGLNQTGQFTGYGTETVDSKGKRSYNTYAVVSCRPVYEGRQDHNISTEMLRWDAYRQLKSINDGTGSLAQMFDVPPTATAAAARMGAPAAGGFGAPAAPGGFGAPAAPGGFGAPAAGGFGKAPAPGGFGAPAPAPGGFGAPAAPGGFGAPAAPGGFGAPAAGGFGAPAAGGFGKAPAPAGFGAPAPGGFGAPAAPGGFGAPAAAPGGFGAPAAGGFGKAPAAPGGFGAPAPGGFGGGFGR